MKKYTFVLLVFSLFITLLSFGANSANASNCAPGEFFNSTTGQACGTSTTAVACPAGDIYSSVTGQRCSDNNNGNHFGWCRVLSNPGLKIGSRGDSVKAFQQTLKDEGLLSGKVDGVYGLITEAAKANHLKNCPTSPTQPTNPSNSTSSITVTSPNGGESYTNIIPVKWTSQNIQGKLNIQFYFASKLLFTVPSVSNNGSIDVNLANYYTQSAYGNVGYVKICDTTGVCDMNNQPFTFTFTPSTTTPSITVLTPNGGETYRLGVDPLSVSWKGTNLSSSDGIQFALVNSNGNVTTANAMGTGLDLKATGGSAGLNPGSISSGSYRLKITDNNGVTDMSDGFFTIILN